ncbi:MAG: fibronectin type III domain-containing protein, partial [Patescibacteria group bacterium]
MEKFSSRQRLAVGLAVLVAGLASFVSALPGWAQTTTTSGDTTPPSVPTNVSATPLSSSTIQIFWLESTDNVGVSRYWIYRNGYTEPVGLLFSTGYSGYYNATNNDLFPGTTYTYTVVAQDIAGNLSPQSASVSATTLSGTTSSDTTPPSVPTNVSVTPISTYSIQISWLESTDNVGVSRYWVYRNGYTEPVAFLFSTGYGGYYNVTTNDLSPGTSYSYTVAAQDTAGNLSPQSASVSATTLVAVTNNSTSTTTQTTTTPAPSSVPVSTPPSQTPVVVSPVISTPTYKLCPDGTKTPEGTACPVKTEDAITTCLNKNGKWCLDKAGGTGYCMAQGDCRSVVEVKGVPTVATTTPLDDKQTKLVEAKKKEYSRNLDTLEKTFKRLEDQASLA